MQTKRQYFYHTDSAIRHMVNIRSHIRCFGPKHAISDRIPFILIPYDRNAAVYTVPKKCSDPMVQLCKRQIGPTCELAVSQVHDDQDGQIVLPRHWQHSCEVALSARHTATSFLYRTHCTIRPHWTGFWLGLDLFARKSIQTPSKLSPLQCHLACAIYLVTSAWCQDQCS